MAGLTTQQIKAARMLLEWDQFKLAEHAGVSPVTIKRLEASPGPLKTTPKTEAKIRAALELGGVLFIDPDGEKGRGVRLTQ